MNKFYNFISNNKKHELYVYGEIIGGSNKWDESDVIFNDFKDKLNEMDDNSTLDIYINSPGGSVFTTQGIVALLRRSKERGITINAYIDGMGASCASWLPFVADNLYVYPQSIMMIHKPMSTLWAANADEMKKEIDFLDKIENDIIIPLYMERAKDGVTEEFIKKKMTEETWFTANEINELFNVTMLSDEKNIVCCADKNVLNRYSNVPKELLNRLQEENNMEKDKNIATIKSEENKVENTSEQTKDNSVEGEGVEPETNEKSKIEDLEKTIEDLKNEKIELETKLNEANEKVIALNDKVAELSPIVDKYNDKLAQEEEIKNTEMLNEKREYFKNKFEQLGARAKFESEEVTTLISNCIKDEKAMSKLNAMIVDLISVGVSKPKAKYENVSDVDNLLVTEENAATKYGFR